MSEVAANPREPKYEKAYFAELHLQNVRSFGPQAKLSLRNERGEINRWTVIVGENATGKSTLLESLYGMRTVIDDEAEHGVAFARDYSPIESLFRSEMQSFSFESFHGGNPVLESRGPSEFAFRGRDKNLTETESCAAEGLYLVVPYRANRRTGEARLEEGEGEEGGIAFLTAKPQLLSSPTERFLVLDYAERRYVEGAGPKPRLRFEQAQKLLLDLLPGVSAIKIGELPGRRLFQLTLMLSLGNEWVPVGQSGYGYRSTLAWVLDFAFKLAEAFPELEDPLQAPAVCLVDEIDLHLHPKWQRTIVQTLLDTFPNVQFVVTAHSPIMVQASAGHNIVLLRRNEETGFVDIVNDVDEIANWRLDQILTSELFGFDSARPAAQAALMRERIGILSQPEVRESQRARLAELEEQIGPIARGETADEIRINRLLDAAIDRLTKKTDWP